MAIVDITVKGFQCERCGHRWVPLDINREPKTCPRCKSPYWNAERKRIIERGWAAVDRIRELNADLDEDEVFRDVTEVVEQVRQEMYDEEKSAGNRRP